MAAGIARGGYVVARESRRVPVNLDYWLAGKFGLVWLRLHAAGARQVGGMAVRSVPWLLFWWIGASARRSQDGVEQFAGVGLAQNLADPGCGVGSARRARAGR